MEDRHAAIRVEAWPDAREESAIIAGIIPGQIDREGGRNRLEIKRTTRDELGYVQQLELRQRLPEIDGISVGIRGTFKAEQPRPMWREIEGGIDPGRPVCRVEPPEQQP